MKAKILTLLPYLGVMAATFYLLPLLMLDTGSAMLILLVATPLITLFCGVACGDRHGFGWQFAAASVLLFVPTLAVFYNMTAWVYPVAYGVLALIGTAAGAACRRRSDR